MFVRNRTRVPFRVSVRSKKIILEPNTVTFIEDGLVTEKQLRDIYGHRIDIINEDGTTTEHVKTATGESVIKRDQDGSYTETVQNFSIC